MSMKSKILTITFLGIFVGIATNLGLIGAQSNLLSRGAAIHALYVNIFSGLVFSVLLRYAHRVRLKFAEFGALCLIGYILLLIDLQVLYLPEFTHALLGYFLACLGFDLLRWIVAEIIQRHLDPARAASYFSYSSAFFEGGTILVVLILKAYRIVLSPVQTTAIVIACCGICLLLMVWRLVPRHHIEIKFSQTQDTHLPLHAENPRSLTKVFMIMVLVFALIESGEEYLIKVAVQGYLQHYDSIRIMTETYFSLSCALIIVFSFVTGRFTKSRRISPLTLLTLESGLMIVLSLVCLISGSLYAFVMFEVLRRVGEYCLHRPGVQMMLSSLTENLRHQWQAIEKLCTYVVAPLFMALLFSFTSHLPLRQESTVILWILLGSAALLTPLLWRLRNEYVRFLYESIQSGRKSAAIMAAHMLSYLRPRDFVARMNKILNGSPKKLLRKTIIIGLGFAKNENSVEVIQREFHSDKEEIQIAVLDALKVSRKFRAVQFMLNVLLDRPKPKTQRVRLNAMAVIGAMYGRQAIPFLLNGLDQNDTRIIANTLEVLGQFREKDLIPCFKRFCTADNPRVRANALVGLAGFRQTRTEYRTAVRASLKEANPDMMASMLFVIGQRRDQTLCDLVNQIATDNSRAQDPSVTPALVWALVRLRNPLGFARTCEIWTNPDENHSLSGFMHFFSLHTAATRYDLIRHLLEIYPVHSDAIRIAQERLKRSSYDFHEELEYFRICCDTLITSN